MAMTKRTDTDGILDLCHCGARARWVVHDGMVRCECTECGEATEWHWSHSEVSCDWNKARQRERERSDMKTDQTKPTATTLIRRCNGCGVTTAIDTVATEKNMRDMVMLGHTVTEIPADKAREEWAKAGPCRCVMKTRLNQQEEAR
jgi:hypothetical protein